MTLTRHVGPTEAVENYEQSPSEGRVMTTIDREPRRDIVPTGHVRAVIAPRFTAPAEPQTRLFWD